MVERRKKQRFTIEGGMAVERRTKSGLYSMAVTAVGAAVLAVVSPFAIPVGPIPISLCTLMICLIAYVLGWRRGTMCVLVYLLLGAVGMPVFSGFSGGLGKILGPTGGYMVGYLPLAAITGLAAERAPERRGIQLLAMVLATALLYGLGTLWYCAQAGTDFMGAVAVCVLPFLPGDGVKIAAVLALGPELRARLREAGLTLEE